MRRIHTVRYQLCDADLNPVGDVTVETIEGSPIKWMDEKRRELSKTNTPEIFIHSFEPEAHSAD